jgi:hypothetical protein|tara:strand:- start:19649 stop:19792 length:144 start_codon:yes stop_codon:yes gene_type:complete
MLSGVLFDALAAYPATHERTVHVKQPSTMSAFTLSGSIVLGSKVRLI